MKRNFLITSLFFLISGYISVLLAQEQCGTDQLHKKLMQTDSLYRSEFLLMQSQIHAKLQNNSLKRVTNQVYTIPVVVHVIHLGEPVGTGTNISDAQIQGAIKGLNDRYRNLIGNGSLDVQINFCLAVRDPNGCQTTGINRVNGSAIPNYSSQGIKQGGCSISADEEMVKSLSRWPVSDYYNIWVVNNICNGQWGGYAYYPWGAPNDGTAIRAVYMTNGSYLLSHEVGHGLNLFHTFLGDNNNTSCPVETNCSLNGDQCCDTPPHKQGDCGASNPCTISGNWENTRYNYMSYCVGSLGRFTPDQINRMQATMLVTPRSRLVNSLGCTPSNLSASASITPNGSTVFCEGGSVTLTANAGASYYWSNGATTQSITANSSGNYSVMVNNANGCSATSPFTSVTVDPIPLRPPIIIGDTLICQGSNQTYSVNAVNGATGYTWTLPSGWIGNSTTNIIQTQVSNNTGTITVKANNNCGSSPIQTLAVTVIANLATPTITAGSATTFCMGGSVTLTSNAASGNQWYKDGIAIPASTGTTLNVTASGSYSVKVSLSNCVSALSNTIAVSVNPIPPTPVITAGSSSTFCSGGSVTLTSSAVSGNQWYKDGVAITGSTGTTFNAITSGSYMSKVNNCVSSNAIIVTVNPLPAQPNVINGNNNVLLGQTVNYSINTIPNATSYNWQVNGGGIVTLGNNSTKSIFWTTAGNYTLTVNGINSCGEGLKQSINVTVSVGTGIVNPDDLFQIKVVPNPSSGEFYITAKGLINKKIKIAVMNNLGQTIYRVEQKVPLNDYYKMIDLRKMADGVYYFRIFIDKNSYLRTVIKQN